MNRVLLALKVGGMLVWLLALLSNFVVWPMALFHGEPWLLLGWVAGAAAGMMAQEEIDRRRWRD